MSVAPTDQKTAVVAILGAPNAGKSTLVNALVGQKVTITSPKVQTTRVALRGIVMEGSTQLVLIDTPGIFKPRKKLERAIVTNAWEALDQAEAIALVVDAKQGISKETEQIIEALMHKGLTPLLVLNKVDVVPKEKLLPLVEQLHTLGNFSETFMISALKENGTEDFRNALLALTEPFPWAYPEDQIADAPLRFMAEEITREKVFLMTHQEVPYSTFIETDQWKQSPKGGLVIHQSIIVERESQKGIILGKGGSHLKRIGTAARKEITELAGQRVQLFLFVKVEKRKF